jgi:hypothetical protein
MISWYIDSSRNDSNYLKTVDRNVSPYMNFFCDRLSSIDIDNLDNISKLFTNIISELPILTVLSNKSDNGEIDIYFRYNSFTLIRFNDPMKSIKREIILNKILN